MVKEVRQQLISAIHPTNRKQLFFIYTFLFAVTLCGVYFFFLMLHRSLLQVHADGLSQHYMWLIQMKHVIGGLFRGEGVPFWSWSSGLGADFLASFGGQYIDPFNFFAVLFPEEFIDVGYTVAIYLRLYVAGLAFLWFGKVVNLSPLSCLWGALAYSFSSWCFFVSTRQSSFVTIAVLFVFLMIGVEKVLRRQSPLPLIASVFFFCAITVYFSYMSAVLVFIYLVIYFIKNEEKTIKHILEFFGRFLLYLLTAVCLAAFMIIPALYAIMHAVRTGAEEITIFHTLVQYFNYITTFASGNEIFQQYSTFTTSALFLVPLVPIVFCALRRKATSAMIMFLCCVVFLFFPPICAFFNGMGYVTGRWCYVMTFFYIWSGLQCYEDFREDIIELKRPIMIFLSFLGIWVTLVCRVVFNINSEVISIHGIVNIAAAFFVMYILTKPMQHSNQRYRAVLLTAVLVVNLIVVYNVDCFPGFSSYVDAYDEYGAQNEKVAYATQQAGTEIDDDTFYRIDQVDYISSSKAPEGYSNLSDRYVHKANNETLMFQTRSIYTYNSIVSGFLLEHNKYLCNNAGYYYRQCIYNNDYRARLDFLTGVKYFLGNNPHNYPDTGANEFAGYGFSPFKTSENGVNIFKTEYALGLGCAFDSYITESEWKSLKYTEREHALMECVVLPSGSMPPKGLAHKDVRTISSGAYDLPYHIINETDVSGRDDDGLFVNKNRGGFTIKIDDGMDDCEVYLTFKNLKRMPSGKEEESNLGRLGQIRKTLQSTPDKGDFAVYAKNGKIAKRVRNMAGNLNGLPDVTDYTFNMGVGNKGSDEIMVSFETAGEYTFDSMEVIAVPLGTFRERAQICMENSLKTDVINDNYVSGHLSTNQANSMLYVSIPYHDGWRAYVDGKETDIQRIDTAYSGVPIAGEGEHKIEFKFRPVGFTVGIFAFVIGVIGCVLIGIWHRKKEKENI